MADGPGPGLWKFVVRGDTPYDVHGVGIRETVRKIAHSFDPGLEGKVRNIKGQPVVEVICRCDEEKLKGFVRIVDSKLKENPLVGSIETGKYEPYADHVIRFDGFEVVREDDLTEMVWALQNAGHAVLSQNKIRTMNLLRGVARELISIQTLLKEIRDKKVKTGKTFRLLSIESMIKEPSEYVEEGPLALLCTLYEAGNNANNLINAGKRYDDPDIIGYLDEIMNAIAPSIENLRNICEKMKLKTALNKGEGNI